MCSMLNAEEVRQVRKMVAIDHDCQRTYWVVILTSQWGELRTLLGRRAKHVGFSGRTRLQSEAENKLPSADSIRLVAVSSCVW